MANLNCSPMEGRHNGLSDIREARRQRDLIAAIADWVMANIPWTVAVPDWPAFHDRWSLLTRQDLAGVEAELRRRADALDRPDADLDAIAGGLKGRPAHVTAAADWFAQNPANHIADPEFVRLFCHITRAELILAAIEHKQRIVKGLAA